MAEKELPKLLYTEDIKSYVKHRKTGLTLFSVLVNKSILFYFIIYTFCRNKSIFDQLFS